MFSFRVTSNQAKAGLRSSCAILALSLLPAMPTSAVIASEQNDQEIITHSTSSSYLKVTLNQITLVKLDQPISEALVGNPAIADITLQNGSSFIITGKSYGSTNIILMNKNGETIFNKSVYVDDDNRNIVRIQRGIMRLSYTCTPHCQPTPTLGDDPAHTKLLAENLNGKLNTINQLVEGNSKGN